MEVGVTGAAGAPVTWTAAGTGTGSVPTPAPSTGAQTAPATTPRRRAAAGTLAVVSEGECSLRGRQNKGPRCYKSNISAKKP